MTDEQQPAPVTYAGDLDFLPLDEYLKVPALSASSAKRILPPFTPASFRQQQLADRKTGSMDLGKVAHAVVLEGQDVEAVAVVVHEKDWRKASAQYEKREAEAAGLVAILEGQVQQVADMAAAILDHPLAAALFDPQRARPEVSMFWTDPETGTARKGRPDCLTRVANGTLYVPDYKTTGTSAHPDEFARTVMNFGYHLQGVAYDEGVIALGLDDDPVVVFVVQETFPPYLVAVHQLDADAVAIGRELNRQAMRIYARCVETGRWPGYGDDVLLTSLPSYYVRRFDGII